jgi:hypothetical protein
MGELETQLEALYEKFKDEETGVSNKALTQFASECNLLNKDLTDLDVELTFQSVKLGKKETLNFDRFKVQSRANSVTHLRYVLRRRHAERWQSNGKSRTTS